MADTSSVRWRVLRPEAGEISRKNQKGTYAPTLESLNLIMRAKWRAMKGFKTGMQQDLICILDLSGCTVWNVLRDENN